MNIYAEPIGGKDSAPLCPVGDFVSVDFLQSLELYLHHFYFLHFIAHF